MQQQFKIEKICKNCGHATHIMVSKKEAAFELVDTEEALGRFCAQCSERLIYTRYEGPDLDKELIVAWAADPNLYFMEQDEELLLAEEKYLDLILEAIDTVPMPLHKQNVLFEALCIIVYDNSHPEAENKDEALKQRVITEIK